MRVARAFTLYVPSTSHARALSHRSSSNMDKKGESEHDGLLKAVQDLRAESTWRVGTAERQKKRADLLAQVGYLCVHVVCVWCVVWGLW